MRILFHHRIASRDGQAVHLEEMIEALRDQGHETILVGPASFEQADFGGESSLISLIKRLLPAPVYELLEVGYNVKAFMRLNKAVKAFKPDFIYERFSLMLLAGIWMRRLRGIPLLLEVNGPLYEERLQHNGLALERLAHFCQKYIWQNADYVLPVTEVLAKQVEAYGVSRSRIAVIPNGINPKRFSNKPAAEDAKRDGGFPGRLVLGFTGFIRAWHAMDRIVDLLKTYGETLNLHLLIVGDGPVRQALEDQAKSLGVSHRMTITGVVERDALVRHLAAFDVALLPGINDYASPLKLFEYMYLGTAIVAPDMTNIREILTDGKDSLLFDLTAPETMTAAILRLCQDAELRTKLGAGALATLSEKSLYWSSNARRVVELAAASLPNR